MGAIFGDDTLATRPWQKGDRALVPAAAWPDYPCEEQNGLGWLVELIWVGQSEGLSTARVRFLEAEGYEDEDLATSLLEPLPVNAVTEARSAEECIAESVSAKELIDCANEASEQDGAEWKREETLRALFSEPDPDVMLGEDVWT